VNRVILATDGDFNVGISDQREPERFIARERKTGIYLSIFGVGLGNLNDALMQKLAQAGNGNAVYIDSPLEARRARGADADGLRAEFVRLVRMAETLGPVGMR
jgi:Ca-activated chloride channel family protein